MAALEKGFPPSSSYTCSVATADGSLFAITYVRDADHADEWTVTVAPTVDHTLPLLDPTQFLAFLPELPIIRGAWLVVDIEPRLVFQGGSPLRVAVDFRVPLVVPDQCPRPPEALVGYDQWPPEVHRHTRWEMALAHGTGECRMRTPRDCGGHDCRDLKPDQQHGHRSLSWDESSSTL